MKKYQVWIGVLLFAALAVGCAKEPSYNGIPLKSWIKQLAHPETELRIEAADAIGRIGSAARKDAEVALRRMAGTDPAAKARVAAILALKALAAPTKEFDEYLAEVTAPLIEPMSEEDSAMFGDEYGQVEEDRLFSGLSEDDISYLEQLEEAIPDTSTGSEEVMPTDPEEQKLWSDARRKEQVDEVLQQFRNPEVLAELLATGDLLEKRFAARLLSNQEGESERVIEALKKATSDPDTVLKKLAEEALKKWGEDKGR